MSTSDQSAISKPPAIRRLSGTLSVAVLIVITVVYAAFFGWLSLERYWAYEMHALDMGNMSQAVWNTIHGHPFAFTNMRLLYQIEAWGTTTRLSFHVEALFPLLSLVYLIYPHPESLLILQTVAIASGAVAIYLLAREVLANAWLAVLFAAIYLLFPTLEALNLYEFHPVALATPLLLFAFYFLSTRRTISFLICAAAATGTKEQIGLVVAMMGLYAIVALRRTRLGSGVAIAGLGWSLFAVLVVEHHYRQPGTLSYLHTRYGYLGHGVSGAIHTVIHDPGAIVRVVFIWPKVAFLERLLAPVGYVGVLAPVALLLAAPSLLLDLFSADAHMYSGLGDNSAELVAVVLIAAILGTRVLLRLLSRCMPLRAATIVTALYLLIQALWSQHLNGFTPIGAAFERPSIGAHQHLADHFVAMVPSGVPVSTQDELDPHLSSRRYLYLFADTGRQPPLVPADDVLLDAPSPTYALPSYQLYGYAQDLLHHGWGVTAANDGLILLHHGTLNRHIPADFYRYAHADGVTPAYRLQGRSGFAQLVGYDVAKQDRPNFAVPNLAYTMYVRALGTLSATLQPIIYETMGHDLIDCVGHPLGLSWYPPSRWQHGHLYAVHMDTLQTSWNVPGTAQLWLEWRSVPKPGLKNFCQVSWSHHGRLWSLGTRPIQY